MLTEPPDIFTESADPVYFYGSINGENVCPVRSLMVGILSRAYQDVIGNVSAQDKRSALDWFCSAEVDYVFSYLNIKDHITLPRQLRLFIEAAAKKHAALRDIEITERAIKLKLAALTSTQNGNTNLQKERNKKDGIRREVHKEKLLRKRQACREEAMSMVSREWIPVSSKV